MSPLLHEIPYRERLGLAEPIGTRPDIDAAMVRPLLPVDTVRFVGESILAIVAVTAYQATDAAELF